MWFKEKHANLFLMVPAGMNSHLLEEKPEMDKRKQQIFKAGGAKTFQSHPGGWLLRMW